jgi:hypothetical protein
VVVQAQVQVRCVVVAAACFSARAAPSFLTGRVWSWKAASDGVRSGASRGKWGVQRSQCRSMCVAILGEVSRLLTSRQMPHLDRVHEKSRTEIVFLRSQLLGRRASKG